MLCSPRWMWVFISSPSKQYAWPWSIMIPISSGRHPGVAQNCLDSGLLTTALSINTAGTLWTVFLVWRFWYRWHLLHHPRLVLSRSKLSLRIWEKVGANFGALAFRLMGFWHCQHNFQVKGVRLTGGYMRSLTKVLPGRVCSFRQLVQRIVVVAEVAST